MPKEMAPNFGDDTTVPSRLGAYEEILQADWSGFIRRNHRAYAYDGQVSNQMFWPDTGLIMSASDRPLIMSRGAVVPPAGVTLADAARPHLGARQFVVEIFGARYTASILVINMAGTTVDSTNFSRTSTDTDWERRTMTVPTTCTIRVVARAFNNQPVASSRIFACSVAERILLEADL